MAGIKETLELLQGIKDLVMDGKQVMADGAITLADLPVAIQLLTQLNDLNQAVQGLSDVPMEVKDLSPDEANQLVAKVLEIVAIARA